jgi:hypothetical protein
MVMNEAIPRVIDSLVDNAIDFSEKGQSIVLRSRRKTDFCLFEVSDSGPGVSKENEVKLFSVFFTTRLTDMDSLFPLEKKPFSTSEAIFYTNQMKMAGQFSRRESPERIRRNERIHRQ